MIHHKDNKDGTILLETRALSARLKHRVLLHPTSLSVDAGTCLAIQGPSGGGKSTLLKALAGLMSPNLQASGQIMLDGEDISAVAAEQRCIGMLFQSPMLFPHLSVGQNIALGMKAQAGETTAQRRGRVDAWLARMDLAGFAARDPADLSGGQQARVALARALAAEPKAMLLDEPFSALDPELRESIRTLTFRHLAQEKLAVVLVTHDQNDVPKQHLDVKLYQMRDGHLNMDSYPA